MSSTKTTSDHRDLGLQTEHNTNIPFARSKIGDFFQIVPELGNQFDENSNLKGYLVRTMPKQVRATFYF